MSFWQNLIQIKADPDYLDLFTPAELIQTPISFQLN